MIRSRCSKLHERGAEPAEGWNPAVQSRLSSFWERGHLYLALSFILFLLFALNPNVGISDWRKEVAYFQYMKASFCEFHAFPWFWWSRPAESGWYPAIAHTSSFVGNPETMLFSPFTPLLLWLDVLTHIKVLAVIHCTIGIAGALALGRRLSWNPQQRRFFAILFLLSPVVLQHLSFGYTPWLNIFFFPWLVFFLSDRHPVTSIAGSAMILALVMLQGGFHIFVLLAALTNFYFLARAIFERKWRHVVRPVVIVGLVALLSWPRIYATAQAYAGFSQPFEKGYNPLNFLVWAALPPVFLPQLDTFFFKQMWMGAPSWDAGLFWGFALVMLAVFLRRRWPVRDIDVPASGHALSYRALFWAALVLLLASFGPLFEWFVSAVNSVVRIPFSKAAEKYPYRFALSSYLAFSLVLAAYAGEISAFVDSYWMRLPRRCHSGIVNWLGVFCRPACLVFAPITLAGVIWAGAIQRGLGHVIGLAHRGEGCAWLSRLMTERGARSVGYYLRVGESIRFHALAALLVATAMCGVIGLATRRNTPRALAITEVALAIPLFFACTMWLLLAVSVPYANYPVQRVLPPETLGVHDGPGRQIAADPGSFTITPAQTPGSHDALVVFPAISYADSRLSLWHRQTLSCRVRAARWP
jgi:hypothetical protein